MPTNFAKTGLLLAALTGIFVAMGAVIGGQTGMVIAFVIALGMNMFSLWQSDKMVLRMYGAEEVDAAMRRRILPYCPGPGAPGRAAHAARLCHEQPAAECVCDRTQPGQCGRVCLDRPARGPERPRKWRA